MRDPEKQTIAEAIAILHDQPFGVSQDIFRNIKTLVRRISNEGFSFLTKTLPKIGKCFDKALSGNVAFNTFGVLKTLSGTCIPAFCGSALRRVFDTNGFLLEHPCYSTVKWFRTFCYYSYKIEVPFDESTLDKFSENFISTDAGLNSIDLDCCPEFDQLIELMGKTLASLDSVSLSNPRFGPGISANCSREQKYEQYVPPSLLRAVFGRSFFHNVREYRVEDILMFLSSFWSAFMGFHLPINLGSFNASKTLFVPKDSRGPRTICCEDSRFMYAQKAIQMSLYSACENRYPFKGRVNFTDQTINQRKTFDKSYSTLDLKDASDRVSLDLVSNVFPPRLLSLMLACRSEYSELPNGKTIRLNKFAPMGSALCFPVMALCAYTSVASLIAIRKNCSVNDVDIYVYGDDIIVKNEDAYIAIEALESVGLLVNKDKSFINSRFTESCGQDTLDETSVVPIRKKKFLEKKAFVFARGKRHLDAACNLQHVVSLSNHAYEAGLINLCIALREDVKRKKFVVPYGVDESPYICYTDFKDPWLANQRESLEVDGKLRGYVCRDKPIDLDLSPYARLRRNLIEGGGEKPLLQQISARSPYLQSRTLLKWGTSYA